MQSRLFILAIILQLALFTATLAQLPDTLPEHPIPTLKVIQSIRPVFLEFEYAGIRDYGIQSISDELGNSRAEVKNNRRLRFKLNIPLVLQDSLRLAMGLSYEHEQFRFEDIQQANYPLYERLEDKSLRSMGVRFYLKKDLDNGRFLKSRFGVDLNGDRIRTIGFSRFFKGNVSLLYGRQKNPTTEIGYGIYAGYDLGIFSAFPVFNYTKILSDQWMLELLLPKSARIIHTPSERVQLNALLEVSGASYHMQDEVLPGFNSLELRKSELRFLLSMNREIYDFIWASVSLGAIRNINFFVSEPRKLRRDAIIYAEPFFAYTVEFRLYLVPPRKMFNKATGL